MKSIVIAVIIALMLTVNAAAFSAEEQPAAQKTIDDFSVIFERNMFSRDRRPPRQERPQRVERSQVLAIYVLRGIAAQKEERVAFVEEQVAGETMKATVGSEVLNGQITEIRPDRVSFKEDDQTRIIRIGEEFGKTETTVVTTVTEDEGSQETTAAQTQTPTAQPTESGGSSGDENDILKRLLERRQSEIGQ